LSNSNNVKKPLELLSDLITEAHTKIQKNFININPVVGVNRKMRGTGIPVDVMTIDCLKTGKRIIIVLHDQQPNIIQYQFSFKAEDPADEFSVLSIEALNSQTLYEWMKDYFSVIH
jgi:hypothetical protein